MGSSDARLPLLLEPDALEDALGTEDLLVVDLCASHIYASHGHIPGAVHLDYDVLVVRRPPVGGMLPGDDHLRRVLSSIGMTPSTHVVAYDDEGGGKAGRLLWTLDVLGHESFSLLNGGIFAWANEGHMLDATPVHPITTDYAARAGNKGFAGKDYILQHLGDTDVVLLDTRTPGEYTGQQRFAARGGHIPGAVNMDWVLAMDQSRNLRLRSEAELREMLDDLGVSPQREVVVYCQTHHRSSHTYVMLKTLGYPRVRGYASAWSEWGNLEDTPVETGSVP